MSECKAYILITALTSALITFLIVNNGQQSLQFKYGQLEILVGQLAKEVSKIPTPTPGGTP